MDSIFIEHLFSDVNRIHVRLDFDGRMSRKKIGFEVANLDK